MNLPGALTIFAVVIGIAILPAFVGWRLAKHKERILSSVFFLIAATVLLLPVVQLFIVLPRNERYLVEQKAKAESAAIVGKDFDYVVGALGAPSGIRHERPATIVSKDKTIQVVGEPYTALEYKMGAYWLSSPNFLVILGSDGKVQNFRHND